MQIFCTVYCTQSRHKKCLVSAHNKYAVDLDSAVEVILIRQQKHNLFYSLPANKVCKIVNWPINDFTDLFGWETIQYQT